jgi:peptidoglycan/xylan/chitin deacetylase (PgdA/CDA1 family)
MQKIAPEYANAELTVRPGDRLHRIVALLFDTYYDDVTDHIAEIERSIEAWRWCAADGKRV